MTDEHITLTESGVEKAKSLHRVPLEDKFVINELEVRGLLWNSRAETLKATIVTQQEKGLPGHRRVYLTTKVVARFGATTGCRVLCRLGTAHRRMLSAIGKGIGRRKASTDSVGAGVGAIAEPATENQQPALAAIIRHKT